ncbi:MAG: YdiU family protein, partial [Comamonas sp.]|nr:YdiU family protein [Comamonas sp.]
MTSPATTAQPLVDTGLTWNNSFAALGPAFFTRLPPRPVPAPYPVAQSPGTASLLGLDSTWLQSEDALRVFSGNALPQGGDPLASVYSGHQFGIWAGQLGDGRALLLGEVQTPQGPQEIQLKGSGLTPYSRMGDGRAVLRSSIREYLCS